MHLDCRLTNSPMMLIVAVLLIAFPDRLYADGFWLNDNYLNDDFTAVEENTLPNGMRVSQKENDNGNNVSIRLKVNYGTRDEHCGSREKAHFLEHLMFGGTSRYTEAELHKMVNAWGGSWNASTYDDMTVYEMDVHGKFQEDALKLLHHMLTDAQISDESVDTTRDIIHRESGGRPSAIKRWAYRQGLFHSAAAFADEDRDPEHCRELEDAMGISRQQLLDAYKAWYVPNNMHLFIVGSLKPDMNRQIGEIFGGMQAQPLAQRLSHKLLPYSNNEYHSRLYSFVDDQSYIGFRYQIKNTNKNTEYEAILLESWWEEKLYEYVRTELGLAYSPSVTLFFYEDYKQFRISIDVNNSHIDEGLNALRAFEQNVLRQPITQADLDRIRMQKLISLSMEEMSNSGYADMFLHNFYERETWGRYLDPEDQYKAITLEDINSFVETHLDPQVIVYISEPEMDIASFVVILIAVPLLLLIFVGRLVWMKLGSRRGINNGN